MQVSDMKTIQANSDSMHTPFCFADQTGKEKYTHFLCTLEREKRQRELTSLARLRITRGHHKSHSSQGSGHQQPPHQCALTTDS